MSLASLISRLGKLTEDSNSPKRSAIPAWSCFAKSSSDMTLSRLGSSAVAEPVARDGGGGGGSRSRGQPAPLASLVPTID